MKFFKGKKRENTSRDYKQDAVEPDELSRIRVLEMSVQQRLCCHDLDETWDPKQLQGEADEGPIYTGVIK